MSATYTHDASYENEVLSMLLEELEEEGSLEVKEAAKPVSLTDKINKVKRQHFTNKVQRLQSTLGDNYEKSLLLEEGDLALKGDKLEEHQLAVSKNIRTAGKKVQNRVTYILEHLNGRTATLNNVMKPNVRYPNCGRLPHLGQ